MDGIEFFLLLDQMLWPRKYTFLKTNIATDPGSPISSV